MTTHDVDFTNDLIEAIKNTEYTPQSYSGRSMYGKTCLGFVVPQGVTMWKATLDVLMELESISEDNFGDVMSLLAHLQVAQDNMGCDTILYFPGVEWVDDGEDE